MTEKGEKTIGLRPSKRTRGLYGLPQPCYSTRIKFLVLEHWHTMIFTGCHGSVCYNARIKLLDPSV